MKQTIITRERYNTLSQMLHGDKSNERLAINIVQTCNIPASFVHILLMIANKYDNSHTLCTPLIQSPALFDYIVNLVEGPQHIPIQYDFDFIITLYQKHCEFQGNVSEPLIIKYLSENYDSSSKDTYLSRISRNKLKPRKNVRK